MHDNELLEVEVVDPGTVPVTRDEALNWIKTNYGEVPEEDLLVDSLILTAVDLCEKFSGLSFSLKTLRAHYEYHGERIELPYGPIGTISSVTKVVDGVDQVLDATSYNTQGGKFKTLFIDNVITTSSGYRSYGIKIEYEAGYAAIPDVAKTAVLMEVARMYFHRGDEITPRISNEAKRVLFPISRNL